MAPDGVQDAARLLGTAQRVAVLTGAGISTASGIPDFRGPHGVWTRDPAAARRFDIDTYVADRGVRVEAWKSRLEHPTWGAEPNSAHLALAAFEESGRLLALITQNIDELHQRAGSGRYTELLELHGSIRRAVCLQCGHRMPMSVVLARVAAGEEDPDCTRCGGILKSDTVSFGQQLDPAVLGAAVDAVRVCDGLVAVGTSLQVHPAAGLVDIAARSGAPVVIFNAEPTPYDATASVVVRAPIEQALPAFLGEVDPSSAI